MRYILIFIISFIILPVTAQTEDEFKVEIDSLAPIPDPYYREDQFYASLSYNLMQGKPPGGYSQNQLSIGVSAGLLRDIPLNKARTFAVALGLGYGYNNIHHNLKVTEDADGRTGNYEVIKDEAAFSNNKLVLHYAELPLEIRWRSSDSISHKFWRVYTGVKVSWLFADKAQYESADTGKIKVKDSDDLNSLVYGVYVSAGWNTWNFYAYYGLTPLYSSDAVLADGSKVNLNSLKLGLIFYIL